MNGLLPVYAATTPKRGGRLRVGIGAGAKSDTLDPATSQNAFISTLIFTVHNHIGEVQADSALGPELAQSWEPSPDAKIWTFQIRKDVEFHNGKTLDATDVVASINHHRRPSSGSPARALLATIAELNTRGTDAVVIELNSGYADFPYALSDYHIPILPAVGGGVAARDGVGAGPYVLRDFEPGVRAAFTRHPGYWKSDRAYFDEVELISIPDVAARTHALRSGEIDVMNRCDTKTVHLLARMAGVQVAEVPGTAHYTIPMRTDVAPFDNNDVRLALKHAIDRPAMLETVLRGHGTIGNDHPISSTGQFHAGELAQRKHDPDKVRYHLKQAGLTSLALPLSTSEAAFAGAVDAAVLFKGQAADAGITIDVVRESSEEYWSKVWMQKPWCMSYWYGRPTADWMFATAYAEGAQWNETRWRHDGFNKLLVAARAELVESRRREMYAEMQRMVRDEGGALVPMFYNHLFAMTDKLRYGTLHGNGDLDGQKLAERWWYAG